MADQTNPFSRPIAQPIQERQEDTAVAPQISESLQRLARARSTVPSVGAFRRMFADNRNRQAVNTAQVIANITPFSEVTEKISNYDKLPFSQKREAYEAYLKKAMAAITEGRPDLSKMDAFMLEQQLHTANPAPEAPDRSALEYVGDVGAGLAAGVLGFGGSISSLVDLATPAPGEGDVTEWIDSGVEWLHKHQSDVEKNARRERQYALAQIAGDEDANTLEKLTREFWAGVETMSLGGFSELAGNIIPMVVGTAGVGVGLRALAAGGRAAKTAEAVAAADKLASRGALAFGVGASSALSAGDAAQSARAQVEAMPLRELKKVKGWTQLVAQHGGDWKAARTEAADDAAKGAAIIGAGVGLAAAALPGSVENTLATAIARSPAVRASRAITGAVIGGTEEMATSVAANYAARQQGADTDLFQGTGVDFALGLIGEGAAAAGVVAFGRRDRRAKSDASLLSEAGEKNTAEIIEQNRDYVTFRQGEVQTRVFQAQDGLWRYASPESPRITAADQFLQRANGIPVSSIPPVSRFAEAAYDDVMNMSEEAFLAQPGVAAGVRSIQRQKDGWSRDKAIAFVRKWFATQRGRAAFEAEQSGLLDLSAAPEEDAGTVDASRLSRALMRLTPEALRASSLMQPFIEHARGDVQKARRNFIRQLNRLSNSAGLVFGPLEVVPASTQGGLPRLQRTAPSEGATDQAAAAPAAPAAPGGPAPAPAAPAEADQPTGVPVMITLEMRNMLRSLGYSTMAIRGLTPAQANEILDNDTPAPGEPAPTPAPAPAAPQPTGQENLGINEIRLPQGAQLQQMLSAQLPRSIRGARPRNNSDGLNRLVDFEYDFDRAAYVVANPRTRSRRHDDFMQFLREASGWSDERILAYASELRDYVNRTARDNPNSDTVRVSFLNLQALLGNAEPAPAPAPAPQPAVEFTDLDATLQQDIRDANVDVELADLALDQEGGTARGRVRHARALQRALARIGAQGRAALWNAVQTGNVPEDIKAITEALTQAGIENGIEDVPNAAWVQAIGAGSAVGGEGVLEALVTSDSAGTANRNVAANLLRAYRNAGVGFPDVERVSYSPMSGQARGSYHEGQHLVKLGPNATANTVVHEMMHGLTVKGLVRLRAAAREDTEAGRRAKDLLALLTELRGQLQAKTGRIYATSLDEELLAEMVRPEAMAAASVTMVDQNALSRDAKRALDALFAESPTNMSVLEAIVGIIRQALLALDVTSVSTRSISQVLGKVAAEIAPLSASSNPMRGAHDTSVETSSTQDGAQQGRPGGPPIPEVERSARLPEPPELVNRAQQSWQSLTNLSLEGLSDRLANANLVFRTDIDPPEVLGDSASRDRREEYFWEVLEGMIEESAVDDQGNPLMELGSTISGRRKVTNTETEDRLATIDITYRGRNDDPHVVMNTESFESESGLGGKFYDAIYGAAVAAGIQVANSGLTGVNNARIPLNRMKAALKWGTIFGDMGRAYSLLKTSPNTLKRWPGAGNLSDSLESMPELAQRIIAQTEQLLPVPGALHLNQDGTFDTPVGTLTYSELGSWLVTNNTFYPATRGFERGTQTPSAAAMAAMLRSWMEADTDAEKDAVVEGIKALNNAGGVFFSGEGSVNPLFQMEPLGPERLPNPAGGGADANPVTVSMPEGKTPTQTLLSKTATSNAQENSVTGPVEATEEAAEAVIQSIRVGYRDVLDGATGNDQAEPASLGRGLSQGTRAAFTQRDMTLLKSNFAKLVDRANELFHDAQSPIVDEMNNWVDTGLAEERPVRETIDSMRAAGGRRDHFIGVLMEEHGGEDMQKAVSRMSKDNKVTPETVLKWAGYWLTAKYAPQQNQRLIDRQEALVEELQARLEEERGGEQNDTVMAKLQESIEDEKASLAKRRQAVADPRSKEEIKHAVKLAGNMSDAQAKALREAVESNYKIEDLQELAEAVYGMNAYNLALGIEVGRVLPETAAAFLEKPEILGELQLLAEMGEAAQNPDAEALPAGLRDQREKVAELVKTEYVPMTGDPRLGLDEELIGGRSTAAPNVGRDYRMEGRESIPDNGIVATLSNVYKGATFAGWRPFQRAIHKLYGSMSPEARTAAGFGLRIAEEATGEARGGVVYRAANGRTYVYSFRDDALLEALRKANMEDSSHFLEALAQPTRLFAYTATQLSPWFAPINWFRDLWERSETIRRYTNETALEGENVDVTSVARRMWKYGMSPDTFKATARFAAGKNSRGTRLDEALKTLAELGAMYTTGDLFSKNRSKVITDIVKSGKFSTKAKNKAAKVVDVYNRTFDLVSVLSAYMALTDQGVPAKRAAAISLDTMNFRKAGVVSPFMQALYAFATPAITGGANMMSLIYDRRANKFKPKGVARLGAYTVGFLMLHAFAQMLSDDDEGGDEMAQLSNWTRYNKIPFPLGEGIITLPMTFGLPRLANAVALNILDIGGGEKGISQGVSDFLNMGLVPAISPMQPSNLNWEKDPITAFMLLISPTLANPLVEFTANVNYFGDEIVKLKWRDKDQFLSEQFGYNTATFYRDIAQELRKAFGVDMAPEQVRHILRGYAAGFPRMALRIAENHHDDNPTTGGVMSEAMRKFYKDPSGKAWKSQFYNMIDRTENIIRKIGAGELTSPTDEQMQLMALRERWDEYDSELRNRKRRVTNSNTMTPKMKERKYDVISKLKDAIQAQFVVEVRKILGKS